MHVLISTLRQAVSRLLRFSILTAMLAIAGCSNPQLPPAPEANQGSQDGKSVSKGSSDSQLPQEIQSPSSSSNGKTENSDTLPELSSVRTLETKKKKSLRAIQYTPSMFISEQNANVLFTNEFGTKIHKKTENTTELGGKAELGARIGVAKGSASVDASRGVKEAYEYSDETPSKKLQDVIEKLSSEDGKIVWDVEYEFADKKRIDKLRDIAKTLKEEFQIDIATLPQYANSHAKLNGDAAKATLRRLRDSSGHYAIISADWIVDQTNDHHLTARHPVSDLFTPPAVLLLDMTVPPASKDVSDSGISRMLSGIRGNKIPLTIFGIITVPRNSADVITKISIEPYAIYGS